MSRNQRGIAQFASLCHRIFDQHSPDQRREGKMSAHVPLPIGTIAFAVALLASALGLGAPATRAFAVDCLTSPSLPVPPSTHWYYHTDRTQQRKCWHLQPANGSPEMVAVEIAGEAPAKPSQPIAAAAPYAAGVKDLVAQQAGIKPSDQDVERLYAQFLEWERRAKK